MTPATKPTAQDDRTFEQYAALCWRMHRGQVEVLLVTSRDTGRWILPKGWPMKGLPPQDAACREAWEEAGAEGAVDAQSLGRYSYTKVRERKSNRKCVVDVFPLRVARLAFLFPEKMQRRRKWFLAREAAKIVDEPDLRKLLHRVDEEPAMLDQSGAKMACNPQKSE